MALVPSCDAECTRFGWVEAMIDYQDTTLHVSHSERADLDDRFLAFDHDIQAPIRIRGWMMDNYERV